MEAVSSMKVKMLDGGEFDLKQDVLERLKDAPERSIALAR